jgi:hypothetical protein
LFDFKILLRATLVGVALHIAFVLVETFLPAVRQFIGLRAAMFAVMMIGGIAGLLYARDLDKGYSPGALGGLVAGMVTVFCGLGLAALLSAPQTFPLGVGTVIGTGIGAVGGVFGQMSANMRKAISKF